MCRALLASDTDADAHEEMVIEIITIKKRKFWGLKEAYFKTFP